MRKPEIPEIYNTVPLEIVVFVCCVIVVTVALLAVRRWNERDDRRNMR